MIWTVVIILSQLAGLYFIYVNTTDFINSGFYDDVQYDYMYNSYKKYQDD